MSVLAEQSIKHVCTSSVGSQACLHLLSVSVSTEQSVKHVCIYCASSHACLYVPSRQSCMLSVSSTLASSVQRDSAEGTLDRTPEPELSLSYSESWGDRQNSYHRANNAHKLLF